MELDIRRRWIVTRWPMSSIANSFNFTARWCFLALVAGGISAGSSAGETQIYHPRMDVSQWDNDGSVLVCRMRQEIPFFGVAEFETWSGGELQFQLRSDRPARASGSARIWVEAPRWKPEHPSKRLGKTELKSGRAPLQLDRPMAARLLAELFKGGTPRFASNSWFSAELQTTEVGLSSATFRDAYGKYSSCLDGLMGVPFDDLEKSKIRFASDKHELNDSAISWLNSLADFLTRSDEVEQVFVDGHTDDTNTTTYNVALSQRRAEAVSDYLVARGVNAQQIVVRFHGERYPIESNKFAHGRAENRRVTIRLQMAPDADLPS